jgi:hypothetical protein
MTRRIMMVCGAVLCLLYGASLATHILAFLGLYRLETFLITAPLAVIGAGWLYTRGFDAWANAIFPPLPFDPKLIPARERRLAQYDRACLIAAVILLLLIFLLRVSLFPWSNVGDLVSADAIAYHFPKAFELARTGTLWDVSFLYAEYPIGYEGLVAGGVLLTGTIFPAGLIQALTIILLITTLALLISRYSGLPIGIALLLMTGLCLHPSLYGLLLLIGKNDLLMTTAILAAVLHSPLTVGAKSRAFHPVGLAFATMLAMSVKATGFIPLGFLWLLVFWEWGQRYWQSWTHPGRSSGSPLQQPIGHGHLRQDVLNLIGLTLLMLPCGFWLIRNLVMMHRPFSPEVSSFFQGNLLFNLTFPKLYSDGPESTTLIALAVWGVIFIALAAWRGGWRVAALLVTFWIAFLMTPLGAFHTPERHTVRIEWRYITYLFLFMAVLIISAFTPFINRAFALVVRRPILVAIGLVVLCGGILIYIDPISGLLPRPANVERLANPYIEGNETGAVSVYDYVRRFITGSVVYYNGIEPFYFYIPRTTNRFMDVTPHPLGMPDLVPRPTPDYLVHRKAWHIPPEQWPLWNDYEWEIVYEDSLNVVYQRK